MTIHIPTWINCVLTPVEKLEAHQKGLKHKAISVFIIRDGQTLLQQRAASKYHTPGLWANACCTHPYWEEDSQDCATRRLQEELGIAGLSLDYRDTVEYRAAVGDGLTEHEVVDIYVAQAPSNLEMDLNPSEVQDTTWIPISSLTDIVREAPHKYTPWLRIYVEQFSDIIFQPASV
ncbi:MAG: isopentenyl-diphosphate Delta-isomerase [Pseudomonadota bacterium]